MDDLEYCEERKESAQTVKKHISLKLKTTNTGNNLAPLLNFNQTTLTSSPQLINSNNPLNNNNNNNNISCINNTIITTNNSNIVNSNHNHVINDDAINSNTLLITPVPNKIQKLNHSNTNSTSNTTTAALNDIDERLDEDFRFKNVNKRELPHKIEKLNWNFQINVIGKKYHDQNIFCCELCSAPIFIYGRMMPCKHAFCIKCAREKADKCPKNSCREPVERIEEVFYEHIFICTYGKSANNNNNNNLVIENQIQTPSKITCGRSYMSQRDLNAHIHHRHVLQSSSDDGSTNGSNTSTNQNASHHINSNNNNNQFSSNLNRTNLITIPTHHEQHQQQQHFIQSHFHHQQQQHHLHHHALPLPPQQTQQQQQQQFQHQHLHHHHPHQHPHPNIYMNDQQNNILPLNPPPSIITPLLPPLLQAPTHLQQVPPLMPQSPMIPPRQQQQPPLQPPPPQPLLPSLLDMPHPAKRHFDFNLQVNNSNMLPHQPVSNMPPNLNNYNAQSSMQNFY